MEQTDALNALVNRRIEKCTDYWPSINLPRLLWVNVFRLQMLQIVVVARRTAPAPLRRLRVFPEPKRENNIATRYNGR